MAREQDEILRLKTAYRQLGEEVTENASEMVKPGSDALVDAIRKGDGLFKQVKTAVEGAEDSRLIAQLAHLGSRKIQELKTESTHFSANEFADKLVNYALQGENHPALQAAHWTNLGAAVQSFFKNPPNFAFMLGSFSRHPLQKKERVKRQRLAEDNSKDKRTNIKLVVDDQEQLETTAHDVSRRILPTLKDLYKHQKQPLDYFEFVIDPDSFGVTVENMFHVSFLIRDGLAQITLDEDSLPVIQPTSGVLSSREDKDKALQSLPRKQLINNFSVNQWKKLKETFNIKKARIPRRSVPHAASQSH